MIESNFIVLTVLASLALVAGLIWLFWPKEDMFGEADNFDRPRAGEKYIDDAKIMNITSNIKPIELDGCQKVYYDDWNETPEIEPLPHVKKPNTRKKKTPAKMTAMKKATVAGPVKKAKPKKPKGTVKKGHV